ncbi:hypothetical protein GCM10009547_38910 [Sporichthya brevicatena]|uniref:Putative host cell surface-exposed lipoprotein Ltp-like HTH region domain-containing protein n=1 Tax=Sporichthya brevicatena TaxID=171442 RepID=A0ABN1H773_9ACTN
MSSNPQPHPNQSDGDQAFSALPPLPPKAPKTGNWFVRHKIATGVLAFVGVVGVAGAVGGSGSSSDTVAQSPSASTGASNGGAAGNNGSATGSDAKGGGNEAKGGGNEAKAGDAKPAEKSEPAMTMSQKNAVRSAESYLELMPFSKLGLIRQLSSSAGDGYSKADATFAVNQLKVDWNEQAYRAAQAYVDMMAFSRSGLIQQLTSSAGDQYTNAQATFAVNKLGL